MAAFRHAVDLGADVIELDMTITADDRILLNHNSTIDLQNCFIPGKDSPDQDIFVRTLTFAQTQEFDCGTRKNKNYPDQVPVPGARMPALEEVFEGFRSENIQFMIETKMAPAGSSGNVEPDHFVRLVHQMIQRFGLEDKIILQSFDHRTLTAMHALNPNIKLCTLNPAKRLPDYVGPARALGATYQFINYRIIRSEDISPLHQAGLQVFSGTVNDPAVWKDLIDMKVDGILTDDPAGLLRQLNNRR